MSPAEYDNILYRDLVLKLEGFKERLLREEFIFRKVAYSAYLGPSVDAKDPSKKNIDKFWPIDIVDETKKRKEAITPEKRAAIREALKEMNENRNKDA